jgi:hypothetical protein
MTNQDVTNAVVEIQTAGNLILQEVTTFDPLLAAPDAIAGMLLNLAASAVKAWANAAGVDPTAENFQALEAKLNPAALTPPTS